MGQVVSDQVKSPTHDDNNLERLKRAARLQRLQQRGHVSRKKPLLPAISVASRRNPLPLSWAQQRLWFLDRLDPAASAAYHMLGAVRLRGMLDRTALRQTLDHLVVRHESLRTTFVMVAGEAVQVIGPAGSGFALKERDLCTSVDVHGELQRLIAEEAATSFDLQSGPLIRGQLLHLSEQQHVLLICMHHIISDGWSVGVLFHEISQVYGAFLRAEPDPLLPLPVQYADYALWQRQWLRGEVLQQQIDFWKGYLRDAPMFLELPSDRARPTVQSHSGGVIERKLSEELTEGLRHLSRRHGVTLFMTLLAGWSVLLARLSGQEDLVIGTPVANRRHRDVESVIGLFVNTLPLRVRLEEDPGVGKLLEQVKVSVVEAYSNQDVPFEQIVEAVQPVRSLSHSPLFQTTLSFDTTPGSKELRLPGLTLSPLERPHAAAPFDVSLLLTDGGERLESHLVYASALFDPTTAQRMLEQWERVLSGMVADDGLAVSRLPLLSAAQREQLLERFNETAQTYPSERCIQELFEEQVSGSPEAVAVEYEGEHLTYRELNERSNRLARYLLERGVQADERAAVCVERGVQMMVAVMGILKAGGAYVPLDTSYPVERLRFMLEDSAPRVLLKHSGTAALVEALGVSVPSIDLDEDAYRWRQHSATNPDREVSGLGSHNLAYIIYTSGSTGTPKGVMVEHRNVVRLFAATGKWFQFTGRDVWTQFHSIAFDFSVWEMFGSLLYGGRLVVVPLQTARAPDEFCELVYKCGVTVLNQTPGAFRQFMGAQQRTGKRAAHLRVVIFGGEALEVSSLRSWYERYAGTGPQLVNMYGITETTVHVTYRALQEEDTNLPRGTSPIGIPIGDLRVYLLDEHREPVPLGVVGEIYVGGAGVARGYLNRPRLTAERFIEDPFAGCGSRGRLYRTGDLARRRADGMLEFVGRNDRQVKIRGYRIELGEIEAQLLGCEGVREAVVSARNAEAEEERLVAYYTVSLSAGPEPTAEQLREKLVGKLPSHMVPAAYVKLDQFPLTPNGKLDRNALPAPQGDVYRQREYAAPQGAVEETLAQIWRELLKVERVGRHDNFFELGGHSFLAVTLIEQMRRGGLYADVRALFTAATLAGLAAEVRREEQDWQVPPNGIPMDCVTITPQMLPLVKLEQRHIDRIIEQVTGGAPNIQDIYPLAPLQEGIFFHHLMSREGDAYVTMSLLSFEGRKQLDGFVAALQWVVERHDILRTAVLWEGLPEPVQVVWRRARLRIEEVQLAQAESTQPMSMGNAQRLRQRFDSHSFRMDVKEAPLLRGFVAPGDAADGWLLLLCQHHLIDDNTTLKLILTEIQAYLSGYENRLPAPVPFRNFVAEARLRDSVASHEEFFRQMLSDIHEPTAPFGLMDVHGGGSEISEARSVLEAALTRRLRQRARSLGVSVASVCHLAWALVLARLTGREEVVFGTVLFGRTQGGEGIDRALGLYINTLPIRISVGSQKVRESACQTHDRVAELLRHEHASLALAQRCSGVPAPAPLFTSLLNCRQSQPGASAAKQEQVRAWQGIRLLSAQERTNYPLTLSVDDFGEGLELTAQVSGGVDPQRINALMHTALSRLEAALEGAPQTPIRAIDILPPEEREQVLVKWNRTGREYPARRCVHELFEDQARRSPRAVAVVQGGQSLTYAQLNERANRLAHYLREHGVRPDARVGICLGRRLDLIVGILGILKAGGAYVPLDPGYPPDRLRYLLSDSEPQLLLTDTLSKRVLGELGTGPAGLSGLPVIDLQEDWHGWSRHSSSNPGAAEVELSPSHLAYVIYTSGSTGKPKGVMIEHAGLLNYLYWARETYRPEEGEGTVVASSLSFDATITCLYLPLLCGLPMILVPDGQELEGLEALLREPRRWSLIKISPAHLTVLGQRWERDWPCAVRAFVIGGEALAPSTVERWQELAPQTRLINEYGPTETVVGCSSYEVPPQSKGLSRISIGCPIANTQIYILDAQMRPVPLGVCGEMYIGGVGVARGYLNRQELTAERFLADPIGANGRGGRLYRTGDLGRWRADGTLEYLGRNDEQVKIRGFRIECGEIEAHLRACRGVHEAVVIARAETSGEIRLVAYVVPEVGAQLSAVELRAQLASVLAEYMVPAAYVTLASLPLTSHGKLDRRALPAPEADAYLKCAYEAPAGEIEITLAAIWQDLLHVKDIARDDHFFDLGGHSLLALRLVARVKEVLGTEVAVRDLFIAPTLRAFAAAITNGTRLRANLVPIRPRGAATPLFFVHPGEGEVNYVRELEAWLDADVPVYGLAANGFLAGEVPHGSVEEMAACYIESIRQVQPSGPYRIAGWSAGGTIAYEMAHQLVRMDERVGFLGLIDTMERYPPLSDVASDVEAGLGGGAASDEATLLLAVCAENTPLSKLERLKRLHAADDIDGMLAWCQAQGILPRDVEVQTLRRHVAVRYAIASAVRRYLRPLIPVPVVLFCAADEPRSDPTLGWQRAVDLQLRYVRLSGTHHTIVEQPHVQSLGQAISVASRETAILTGRPETDKRTLA